MSFTGFQGFGLSMQSRDRKKKAENWGFEAWVFGLGVQETRFLSLGGKIQYEGPLWHLKESTGFLSRYSIQGFQLASITRLWGLGPGGLVLKSLGLRYIIFLKELHQFP